MDMINNHIIAGKKLQDSGYIGGAIDYYRKALCVDPNNIVAGSNLLLCLNYSNYTQEEIFDEHVSFGKRLRTKCDPTYYYQPQHNPDKRPIKIGYVSGDFKTHSVSYFIEPVLKHHDRKTFKIFCYSDVNKPDPVTVHLMRLDLSWRDISNKDDNEVTKLIRDDNLDILVDLSGHMRNKRLPVFMKRAAPIQITYLGYPNTTGLSTMDYRITDELVDMPGQLKFYTEKLYRMKGCFLTYSPPIVAPAVSELPALKNGYVTFGSFNNLTKINDTVINVWSEILKNVPGSKLFVKNKAFNDKEVIERYKKKFTTKGINKSRLKFEPYEPTTADHLKRYSEVDIALDTFPYNGTTTTCEALWMGVPVIALEGISHASRVGVTLLKNVGLSSISTIDTNNYIGVAIFLANDLTRLSLLRDVLRDTIKNSTLCNHKAFTRKLELAYIDILKRSANDRTR